MTIDDLTEMYCAALGCHLPDPFGLLDRSTCPLALGIRSLIRAAEVEARERTIRDMNEGILRHHDEYRGDYVQYLLAKRAENRSVPFVDINDVIREIEEREAKP